jgi:hypothetical protein
MHLQLNPDPLPSTLTVGTFRSWVLLQREKSRSVLAWTWRSDRRRRVGVDAGLSLEEFSIRLVSLTDAGLSLENFSIKARKPD